MNLISSRIYLLADIQSQRALLLHGLVQQTGKKKGYLNIGSAGLLSSLELEERKQRQQLDSTKLLYYIQLKTHSALPLHSGCASTLTSASFLNASIKIRCGWAGALSLYLVVVVVVPWH